MYFKGKPLFPFGHGLTYASFDYSGLTVRQTEKGVTAELTVTNKTKGKDIKVLCELSGRTRDIILAGGLLDYTRESMK